jgi:hypothetical protein
VARLRAKLESQLTMVSLDAGPPGAEVAEINWPALEEHHLG